MRYFDFAFEGQLSLHQVGHGRAVTYQVLFLPTELAKQMPFSDHPRLRVEAEIGDMPTRGAFQPAGDGRHYIMVPPDIRKALELVPGDMVDMRFRIDDQAYVDVPKDLEDLLRTDVSLKKLWDGATPGRQRGFAHHVDSAKRPETVRKRLSEVKAALIDHCTVQDLVRKRRQ